MLLETHSTTNWVFDPVLVYFAIPKSPLGYTALTPFRYLKRSSRFVDLPSKRNDTIKPSRISLIWFQVTKQNTGFDIL